MHLVCTLLGKVWVSIKFLSAKFGFTPPAPEQSPKSGNTVQISRKSSKLTLFLGGGEEKRNVMDKTMSWTSGRFPDTAKLRIWTLRFWVFRAQDCLSRDRCSESVGTRHAFFLSF